MWKTARSLWQGSYGGFLKWWYPTTMGFPTKNDHFGVFWGYHHLRKHPYITFCYLLRIKFRIAKLVFKKLEFAFGHCENMNIEVNFNPVGTAPHIFICFVWMALANSKKKANGPIFHGLQVFVSDPVGVTCEQVAILSWSLIVVYYLIIY